MAVSYEKISYELISDLDPRTRDIVAKRFGLSKREPLTLDRIGQDHGITRERVRQIVDDTILNLQEQAQGKGMRQAQSAFQRFEEALEREGRLKKEDLFVRNMGGEDSASHVIFLLNLGGQFQRHKETEDVYPFWTSREDIMKEVPSVLEDLLDYFRKRNDVAHLHELKEVYEDPESPKFSSVLEVSKHIARSLDGRLGLKHWPHVYPKTIRDKAYLALKHAGEPLHFNDVAKTIGEIQFKLLLEKQKKILPQTVHNELIKDPRFVLVGRGKYALAEWGFQRGTVKDVISSILKKEKKGLSRHDLLKKTLGQRQVKESTVMLNLQDRSLFSKDESGRYHLKVN